MSEDALPLQVKKGAVSIRNPFQSLIIIKYYLEGWLKTLPAWSQIDPRRDPVVSVAAGTQERIIGLAKQRMQQFQPICFIAFLKKMAVGVDGEPALLHWDAVRFIDSHLQAARNMIFKQPARREAEAVWMRPGPDRQLGGQLN